MMKLMKNVRLIVWACILFQALSGCDSREQSEKTARKLVTLEWHWPAKIGACSKKSEGALVFTNNSPLVVKSYKFRLHAYTQGNSRDLLSLEEDITLTNVVEINSNVFSCFDVVQYLSETSSKPLPKGNIYVIPELLNVEFFKQNEFIP